MSAMRISQLAERGGVPAATLAGFTVPAPADTTGAPGPFPEVPHP
ncbi:hypothetical protein [Kitasatospora sp. NPDC056531]